MTYADDTQLYLVLDSKNRDSKIQQLEDCIRGVKAWTVDNKLLLNDSKTEIIHITSRFKKSPIQISSINIGMSKVEISLEARNLGAIIDRYMALSSHVTNVCRSASLAISMIGRIRKYIDRSTAEKFVHAFVT